MKAVLCCYDDKISKRIQMKNFIIIFLTAVMLITSSCTSVKISENTDAASISESSSRDLFAMDTFMTLKAYGENRENALSAASEKILELEKMLSVTDEKSEIWKLNHSDGVKTEVSEETAFILSEALKISEKSDGALDPTVYPVLREWGFTTGEYKIPEEEKISSLLENTGWEKLSITDNKVTVPENMMADLGAAAKGYTSDAVMKILSQNGVTSAVISLGGNVQTLGSKPDGSDWKVSVRDPFDEQSQMCILSVSDKAVVTSGDYERFFIGDDGKKYCHIIDPSDGHPADNGIVSATIISDSGLLCDCLSTAVFVMGKDRAYKYWNENGGFDMILVSDDGRMFVTEGIDDNLEVINGMEKEILK